MDDPGADRVDLEASLAFIRRVNRRLGGTKAALGHLARWTAGWPEGRPLRVIDLGTGSADIPLAMVEWGRARGIAVEVTAVDAHPVTLELAREFVGPADGGPITFLQADCLKLMDHFEPGRFDVAHAGMFLHHLEDIELLTVLRIMDRLAGIGMVWNDLVRGAVELAFVRLLVIGQPPDVRHDAIASVMAGFTKREVLDLVHRAGWTRPEYTRHLFGRFTATGAG